MFRIYISSIIILMSFSALEGQVSYYKVSPFFTWKAKLSAQIKSKPLITIKGIARESVQTVGSHYRQHDPVASDQKMWGGLYWFQMHVDSEVNVGRDIGTDNIIYLITSYLNGMILDGQLISVTGAFNEHGNFICTKIINQTTGHIAVDWDKIN